MTTKQKRINKNKKDNKDNSHKRLLAVRDNAVNAKENARTTMSRVSKESHAMNKPDKTLAKTLDKAEQRIHHRVLSQATPIDIFPEIKRKTINHEITRSQQLEQLLNDLTEEKARKKIEEIKEEARICDIEIQKVLEEVETIKKAAEDAVRQAQEKVKAVSEEIKAVRQQALTDANQARADVLKAREETEIARSESRKAREETEAIKTQAAAVIRKVQEENLKMIDETQTSHTRINASLFQARQHVSDMTQKDTGKKRQAIQGIRQPSDTPVEKSTVALPGMRANPGTSRVKEHQQLLDTIMEMHNPLHSISGFARMILDDNICDTAAQKEFLATILQQSENLKLQLDNIYHFIKSQP
jgi:hypothetical protein